MNKKKIAFLFVGQGSQYIGMGKDLYENIPECKSIFDKGEEILKMPIKELIFNGPDNELMDTKNAQPAILLASLASLKALEINGIEAEYAAGLSLGEYGALVYGGALSLEDSILLVKERGRIMDTAVPNGVGKMAAIMRLDDEKMEELLKKSSEYGVCEGANYNCPGQVVISGHSNAIDYAIELASELGGRGIPLNVSGPFHSSLLEGASNEFYTLLEKSNIDGFKKIIYSNVKGIPYSDNDDVRLLLKKHIMSSVHFESSIRDMLNRGVDTFVEIGPGKALRGFIKKIDRKAKLFNVEDMESLSKTIEALKVL